MAIPNGPVHLMTIITIWLGNYQELLEEAIMNEANNDYVSSAEFQANDRQILGFQIIGLRAEVSTN